MHDELSRLPTRTTLGSPGHRNLLMDVGEGIGRRSASARGVWGRGSQTRGAAHSLELNERMTRGASHITMPAQPAGTSNKHAEGRNPDPAEAP